MLCLLASGASAQTISLVIVEPGKAPSTWFGHSALLVEGRGEARLYSYGVIEKNVRTVFDAARGTLSARAASVLAEREFARYAAEGRAYTKERLLIDRDAAMRVASRLELDAARPVRFAYDFLTDNCSTRLRDVIDDATRGQLKAATQGAAPNTIRAAGGSTITRYPALHTVADFMIGSRADRPVSFWEFAAVPVALGKTLRHAGLTARVATPPGVPYRSPIGALIAGIAGAIGLIVVGVATRRNGGMHRFAGMTSVLLGTVLGIPGLVLAWVQTLGAHTTLSANINIFFANPLAILAIPLGLRLMRGDVRASARLRSLWLVIAIIAAGASITAHLAHFPQSNAWVVAITLPLMLSAALSSANTNFRRWSNCVHTNKAQAVPDRRAGRSDGRTPQRVNV